MKYLNSLSHARFVKTHGSQFFRAGTPDIIGCYRGQMFAFEVKREGEQPTERQAHEINAWIDAGAVAGVVWAPVDCQHYLWYLLSDDDREIKP